MFGQEGRRHSVTSNCEMKRHFKFGFDPNNCCFKMSPFDNVLRFDEASQVLASLMEIKFLLSRSWWKWFPNSSLVLTLVRDAAV